MKIRRFLFSAAAACLFSAATVCAVLATPAFAQAPNPDAERYFQKYLAAHPELQRNPGLMTDPRWLNDHPSFHKFLEEHPNVSRQAHQMAAGAYDEHHNWHDRNWWMKNRRDWVQQNQPGWIRPPAPAYGAAYGHPPYGQPAVVGDYDDKHQWHDRNWWVANKRQWVQQHHPDWVQHHDHDHDHDYH